MNPQSDEHRKDCESRNSKPSFLSTVLSVMQASFGVQSGKNRQRDFASGSIKAFIFAALLFTSLFVLVLVLVVKTVLSD